MKVKELLEENMDYLNKLQDKDAEIKELKQKNEELMSYANELREEIRMLKWDILCLEDDLERMGKYC